MYTILFFIVSIHLYHALCLVNFKTLISDSLCLTYSSIGYNYLYGHSHQKFFNVFDTEVANTIRLYRQQLW